MSDDDRVKRPRAQRTQPIRNFATLFGAGAEAARKGMPFDGAAPRAAAEPGASAPGSTTAPSGDPISRGVDLGYRVIDAYMREGQKAAQKMWAPYTGSVAPGADVQQRLSAMFRQTADLAAMWFDLSGAFGIPGMTNPEAPGSVVAGPFESGKAGAATESAHPAPSSPAPPTPTNVVEDQSAQPMAVTIELISPKPAEVSIELRPRSAGIPLRVHDLRDVDPDKPRLRGATVIATVDGVRVGVEVPADQPPGVYTGVILDERTSLPRGVLSVRIRERG